MRLVIMKVIIFFVIVTVALFDYRLLTYKEGKILIANWNQVDSWADIEQSVFEIDKAEVYPSRFAKRSNRNQEEKYLVLYLENTFYNVKVTDLEMDRITQLMQREQVEVVEIEPVQAGFYGLLVVLLIVFPVMRKVD